MLQVCLISVILFIYLFFYFCISFCVCLRDPPPIVRGICKIVLFDVVLNRRFLIWLLGFFVILAPEISTNEFTRESCYF